MYKPNRIATSETVTIREAYLFSDGLSRDSYFTNNPSELLNDLYAYNIVDAVIQQYSAGTTSWNNTPVTKFTVDLE